MSAADRKMTMTFPGAPAPPLEDDNILSMILVRLPPLPSSLPRASAVCKHWRRLVTQPDFRRSFLAHHKKAPILGFFCSDLKGRTDFSPAMDPPNRMPMPSILLSTRKILLACHHGRLLFLNNFPGKKVNLVVWDPITGDCRHIDIPQIFAGSNTFSQKGVVVCASREKAHVHGACHSEPFQVVIIGCNMEGVIACVYSSETCTWGNLISLSQPQPPNMTFRIWTFPADSESSLVGNSVYWAQVRVGKRDAVLEFDLNMKTLAIIDEPPDASNFSRSSHHHHQSFILPADGGGISFIVVSGLSVHVWKRTSNGHGVAGWLFESTVEVGHLLSLN